MDSAYCDAFGGAFTSAPQVEERENYDDLLGLDVPVEDVDQRMHDFEEIYSETSHKAPIATMINQQDENSNTTSDRQNLGSAMLNWETTATVPQHSNEMALTEPKRINAVVGDHISSQYTGSTKLPTIKKERLDGPFLFRIPLNDIDNPIEISEAEDMDSFNKYDTRMADDSDSDKDGETLMLRQDRTSVPIKKEDDEVKFLWENMGDRVIELDSDSEFNATSKLNLGNSFLKGLDPKGKGPRIDRSAALRAQEAYLRTHRRNNGIPEPSSNRGVLDGLGNQGPKRSGLFVDDESAWMKADYTTDKDNGETFRALKKRYNAKVRTDSNTFGDDIEFIKVEKAENLRLARLKVQYEHARGYDDDDDSDDGLFISPSPKGTSRPKRHAIDDLGAEDGVPKSRSAKQRKPNSNDKRPQWALGQEESNMVAGIEDFLRKTYGERGNGGKKDGSKKTKRACNKTGTLNGSRSLLTSNVYEDADANLDREALPVSGHTHKQKALAALVASVPLGTTKKDATAEKNLIRKSTVTLGRNIRGSCKADGENNWKLTGLKSSLRHHQVIGAAWMADRENGGEEPLGGILADAMGLGKTVMTLALLTANPAPRGEKNRSTLIVCTPGLLVQCKLRSELRSD